MILLVFYISLTLIWIKELPFDKIFIWYLFKSKFIKAYDSSNIENLSVSPEIEYSFISLDYLNLSNLETNNSLLCFKCCWAISLNLCFYSFSTFSSLAFFIFWPDAPFLAFISRFSVTKYNEGLSSFITTFLSFTSV